MMENHNCSQCNVTEGSNTSVVVSDVPIYVGDDDKIVLPKIRFLLSYACNLQCQYCFFPLNEKRICSRAELANSFKKWSRKLRPKIVCLYGGEPLLNPDIIGIVADARHYWERTTIEIITNGILLLNISEEVLLAFKEYNVYVTISRHLRTPEQLDKIESSFSLLKQYGILHGIYKADLLWRALYTMDEEGVPVPHNERKPVEAFARCDGINTTSIRGDYLYKCSNVATCAEMVKKGLLSSEWNDFLTHNPVSFENTISEIMRYLTQGVMAVCSLCAVKYPEIHEPRQFSGKEIQHIRQAIQRRLDRQWTEQNPKG